MTSLEPSDSDLGSEMRKREIVGIAHCKNAIITSLHHNLGSKCRKALAVALCKNPTMNFLNSDIIILDQSKVAFCKSTAITLNHGDNNLESE
ncbi:hypothetical protein C2G38_2217253 [Gigaspora rosea]|uniref:Uncharacterized protein n=1 Tax=Gigaspora rosea TaxID=44941 RepID=A0A397U7X3_9GLOM|nr:hypothetical protein C2G38_2217253 [Gigaspora rosea]